MSDIKFTLHTQFVIPYWSGVLLCYSEKRWHINEKCELEELFISYMKSTNHVSQVIHKKHQHKLK